MCEFIIISPEIDKFQKEPDSDFEKKWDSEKKVDSPRRIDSPKKLTGSPLKVESLGMSLPKEFVVSSNPFLTMHHTDSNSPNKGSPITNNVIINNNNNER